MTERVAVQEALGGRLVIGKDNTHRLSRFAGCQVFAKLVGFGINEAA